MNNKIVSVVLVAGIAATGFAGISAASDSGTWFFKGNTEIKELLTKVKSGEELTITEQATLDEAKENRGERVKSEEKWAKFGGKRMGGWNLTDEEKTEIEVMSDEEKKAFFTAKKSEMTAEKESKKVVMAALIAGETLTAEQEAIRLEMIANRADIDNTRSDKKEGSDIMGKILAGDELTIDEETQLVEMQAKRAERELNQETSSENKAGGRGQTRR